MDNFVDDRIEKIVIVGDEDQCFCIVFQLFFQLNYCIEIEVVSWFIEQQQIGVVDQCLGEVKVYMLVVGKIVDWLFKLFIVEIQIVQQVGGV